MSGWTAVSQQKRQDEINRYEWNENKDLSQTDMTLKPAQNIPLSLSPNNLTV